MHDRTPALPRNQGRVPVGHIPADRSGDLVPLPDRLLIALMRLSQPLDLVFLRQDLRGALGESTRQRRFRLRRRFCRRRQHAFQLCRFDAHLLGQLEPPDRDR